MGHEISLLPVTKIQFERFCADTNKVPDGSYEAMLNVNESVASGKFNSEQRERLFITGVLPEEAIAFTEWLGPDYTLPTAEDWFKMKNWLENTPVEPSTLVALAETPMSADAHLIVDRLVRLLQPLNWSDLTLLHEGILEWVRKGQALVLMGSTRPQFHPLTGIPDPDHPYMLADAADRRQAIVGFRYIRYSERGRP